jgi:hypothetical protein
VDSNTMMALGFAAFVATNNLVKPCSNAFELKHSKFMPFVSRCRLNNKAIPISNVAGEGHASQTFGDSALSISTSSMLAC